MSDFWELWRNIMSSVGYYYIPILFVVSTIANCLCIFVTFRTELKDMVSRYYFIAMNISNEGMIMILGYSWIMSVIYGSNVMSSVWFFITMYLPSYFKFLSNYFILALIVERFKATRFPQRRVKSTAAKITIIITILGFLPMAYWFFVHDPIHYNNIGMNKIWYISIMIIKAIISELGPYIITIILSTRIFTMIRRKPTMGNIVTSTTNDTNGTDQVSQHTSRIMSAKETKITKMLVIVAVVYVILNSMSALIGLLFFIQDDWMLTLLTLWQFANFFACTSLGITFFVCCAIERDFGRTTLAMISRRPYPHSGVSQRIIYTRGNHESNAPILTTSSINSTLHQEATTPNAKVELGDCANV